MKDEILYKGTFSLLRVELEQNEGISALSSAFVSMSSEIQIETKVRAGQIKSLGVDDEDALYISTYRARGGNGEVMFAPRFLGEIQKITIEESLLVRPAAYLAATEGVKIDTKWGGAGGLSKTEGLQMLRCNGRFDDSLFLSFYGAKYYRYLRNETFLVDLGHLVALGENIRFRMRQLGGLKNTMLQSEGRIVELTGHGVILMQSRNSSDLLDWFMEKVSV